MTDQRWLEERVERVAAHRDEWVAVPIPERIAQLRACIAGVDAVAGEWVATACRERRIDPASPLAGEEWLAGPMVTLRNLRAFITALELNGQPRPPALRRQDDQYVARVFPGGMLDRLFFPGVSAEVFIEPGQPASQGRIYRDKAEGRPSRGRVALVLGAGNVSSIAPLDVAYKLLVEDQVVVLKMNPVNDYLEPFFRKAFEAWIRPGYLEIVSGGADVGEALCRHPQVETLHLTGSDRTYDAIVWGADPDERRQRKQAGTPRLDKTFSAELGCVTPVLVVPGAWSEAELDFQSYHVAAMVAHNASFNCTAAKVLVTAAGWPQRATFLERVRRALAGTPPRHAYYPGAEARYAAFLDRYPAARAVGQDGEGVVPWTLIPDVPTEPGEYALNNEAFCGVLADVAVDAGDAETFLERATTLANDRVWGTLSCVLLIDPRTERRHAAALSRSIAGLRYGTIGVNAWGSVGFAIGAASWGAYPGNRPEAIGSGSGVVHNAYLFDHPQKSVVRAPFRLRPKPVWFADHRTLRAVGERMTRFEARRRPSDMLAAVWAALRG